MSLIKPNNEYITVEWVTSNKVYIRVHQNAEQRTRYKNWTMSRFETTLWEDRDILVDLNALPDTSKSIKNNQIAAWYNALKALPEFQDSIDW